MSNKIGNPFIPYKTADAVIIDGRASREIIDNIKRLDIEVYTTKKCNELYDAISYHPDIVLHPINNNTIIVAPNVYEFFKDMFFNRDINIIKGESVLKRNYPDNIAYNVGRIGNYAIHNIKYTDEKLKYYLKKIGVEFIHVEQGYTKCATAILDNNGIITSDPSIYEAVKDNNIDVLFIQHGHIDLPGLNYGFIGGSCGAINNTDIAFTGTLDEHPNKTDIENFITKRGKNVIYLSNQKIIDLGTIIPLVYN
ncbi:DUF6873 family GME fold protein [Clostridiisalibacter paucivorans]|uniref:DUF6873 family GME fold protein n=1 Tax=Clostridiisalibacter paucivorans TaxID=408753 RepID=UPI00068413C6|nr:hypothetical protein [Clostridiisalibacter paucivorans]